MPHGRIDEETTVNVASIHGGVAGTNVVPERCTRDRRGSLDRRPARVDAVVDEVVAALHDAANDPACECDVDVIVERLFEGYRLRPGEPAVAAAEAALRSCGYEPSRVASGGGADANAFIAAGLTCVNLANGTERNHEPTERVSQAALEGMLDVTLALLGELG